MGEHPIAGLVFLAGLATVLYSYIAGRTVFPKVFPDIFLVKVLFLFFRLIIQPVLTFIAGVQGLGSPIIVWGLFGYYASNWKDFILSINTSLSGVAVVEQKPNTFWDSIFGQILRWIIFYLPTLYLWYLLCVQLGILV